MREHHNSDDRRQWWGVPGRTLHAVLTHLKGDNELPMESPSGAYREEVGVIVLSDSDDDGTGPTPPLRTGDLGQGCSKDDGDLPSDGDGDDDDYTAFYKLFGMN
ncbi:hypothetical protein D1007_44193 [Hordeum vulgare]|nr:hypothetical protein D1007_44193 [Hordeum vulgare]